VVAAIFSAQRNDRFMQELISRLNLEPSVVSVHWDRSPGRDV
jgi:hypothetical protein